jgi:hypothetical protein
MTGANCDDLLAADLDFVGLHDGFQPGQTGS